MKRSPKLNAAIFLWKNGEPIDVKLWVDLAAEGFDVSTLQSTYLN